MPVNAQPWNQNSCCPTSCDQIDPLKAVVTVTDTGECTAETMGLRCVQSQDASLEWTFRRPDGVPLNLFGCNNGLIWLRLREALSYGDTFAADLQADIVDGVDGVIKAKLPADATSKPGVFHVEVAIRITQEGDPVPEPLLKFTNYGYLIIEPTLFRNPDHPKLCGPPRINDILGTVRMGDPNRSDLLRNYEFNIPEIALALIKPVEFWNSSLPPVDPRFCTSDFPFSWQWRDAAIAELMRSAAMYYLRDHMPYTSPSGASFDDKAKFEDYYKVADQKWNEYVGFVLARKVSWNISAGFGFLPSPYSYVAAY